MVSRYIEVLLPCKRGLRYHTAPAEELEKWKETAIAIFVWAKFREGERGCSGIHMKQIWPTEFNQKCKVCKGCGKC